MSQLDPTVQRLGKEATIIQAQAADPTTSAWVSASAGSGKTKVLVDRLLRLLLAGAEPHRILALTFTNAAAAEMANRLNEQLADWAIMTRDQLSKRLEAKLLGRLPYEEELRRAQALFALVLDTPGGMKIQTIHAFCQSLLGRFPVESNTPARFRLLDDRSTAELFDAELAGLMQDANQPGGNHLRDAVAKVAEVAGDSRFRELMEAAMHDRSRLSRAFDQGLEASVAQLATKLEVDPDQSPDALIATALSQAQIEATGFRNAWQVLMDQASEAFKKKIGPLQSLVDGTGDPITLWPLVRKTLLKADGEIATHNFPAKKIAEAFPTETEQLRDFQTLVRDTANSLKALDLLAVNRAFLTLSHALLTRFERAKARKGVLDFDDLIQRAGQLLQGGLEPLPGAAQWVHFKLDQGIDHILVDEAQDTNPDQWAVIRGLADLFFDDASGQEERMRTLFVVGDEKQSIYSFQRADPRAFSDMRDYFGQRAREAEKAFAPLTLDISFRSTPEVLDSVNASFAPAGVFNGVAAPGTQAWPEHKAFRANFVGEVKLWPLFKTQSEKEAKAAQWRLPLEPQASDNASGDLARALAEQVYYWCYDPAGNEDPNCYLPNREQTFAQRIQPGDIMVLVRSRSKFVDELTAALKSRGVTQVAGRDRMKLSQQLVVQDLLSLAQFLVLAEDDLNLAGLIKSPLLDLSEEQLFDLSYNRGSHSIWRRMRESLDPEVMAATQFLRDCLSLADTMPIYELFVWVLGSRKDGGLKALLTRLGPDAEDAVAEFLSLAMDYDAQHPPSLQGFLHWFARSEQEVKRDLEQEADKLRIMTVHGSKGLQAPVVIMPVLGGGASNRIRLLPQENGAPLWSPRKEDDEAYARGLRDQVDALEEQEARRLLYVAMTRAEDRLLACGAEGKRRAAGESWYDLIKIALDDKLEPDTSASALSALLPEPALVYQPRKPTDLPLRGPSEEPAKASKAELPAWINSEAPGEPSPPRPLKPSEDLPEVSGFKAKEDARIAIRRGIVIHTLLQFLPDLEPEKRLDALRRYLDKQNGLPAGQSMIIEDQVMALLDNPDLAFVFAPGSKAEVPITGLVGSNLISGRIDRLHVGEDQILISDFKSGSRPKGASASGYEEQIKRYAAVLAQIYPGHRIDGYLVWTQSGELEKVAL